MNLFLQGAIGIGKSYLLRQAFLPYADRICGFTVQRLYEGGEFVGFRLCPIDGSILPQDTALQPGAPMPANAFIYKGERRPDILERGMAEVAKQCGAARHASEMAGSAVKLVLLDEIGGFELKSPAFLDSLFAVLDSGLPVAGVFKSLGNLRNTLRRTGLDEEYLRLHSQLQARLEGGGEIITLTEDNRVYVAKYLSQYATSIFGDG